MRELLIEGGFAVREIALVPRPTPLKTGMEGWLRTFGRSFFDQFSEPERTDVLGEVVELLAPLALRREGGVDGRPHQAALLCRARGLRVKGAHSATPMPK